MNDIAPIWKASCTVKKQQFSTLVNAMYILLSVSKVAKCLQNCLQRDLLSGSSSRIYEEGNNSHFLLFMNLPWLIIQALELCQCASNFLYLCLKCTSQNIIHHTYYTLTKQIKSFLKGLFYLKSVIFLGLPFLPPNAILRTYVAQPNFNSTYYFDSH